MKRYTIHLVSLLGLALALAFLIPQRAAADDDDPPGRVARLGFVRGTVSFEPAGTEDWVSAVTSSGTTTTHSPNFISVPPQSVWAATPVSRF